MAQEHQSRPPVGCPSQEQAAPPQGYIVVVTPPPNPTKSLGWPCIVQRHHECMCDCRSSCYVERQKQAQKTTGDLQAALENLERAEARLKQQDADRQAAEACLSEHRATIDTQHRELLQSRAAHSMEVAELKIINQAVEEVLEMKKQRISELEAAVAQMDTRAEHLAADMVEYEDLKLRYSALEADHTAALDIANALFEGEAGSTPAELIGQNKALEQQLSELRDENRLLREQLEAAREEHSGGGSREHKADEKAQDGGDEGTGKKRRR